MSIRLNSPRAWFLAARPKTLSGALIPVLIAVVAATENGEINVKVAVFCALFALTMQIAANFINDLYDFLKGTDDEERLGPERACAQGWVSVKAMKIAIGITLSLAIFTGFAALFSSNITNFAPIVLLGAACIIFAFLYTTILSYCGGGDVLVWVFFGLVPVVGTFYLLTGDITLKIILLAISTGLVTDTLLVLNNYRDRDTDKQHGKRTLIVVFGECFGSLFYLFQGVIGAILVMGVTGQFWTLFYLGSHIVTWQRMKRIHRGRELNGILARTSVNMMLFAVCVAVSLIF